ncbi:pyruvate formate lyase family protein [Flammeovirga kamogawensis]|uniref:Pyruvate formate lyase family protein n=1 Tax=Flammeovirga kamogawensis TaxID=373891 RepID=A0ABX8H3J9_9BACT|nr:pyruvate formate lyase family protein [Flammeovirga kamogawensis]MBB6461926.1 formate C-acetyltransferase [Flammeovirga kamogawensis]QWG10465.1 pyruvate formate lyase family protein [Flammeovirga kamogawensis]TRX63576.1 formate acetyltransferase [Flammeovirga kamogawensis]
MNKYYQRIQQLKQRKQEQTQEKIAVEGLLDEDDYGRIALPENAWEIIPNHADGSFYGIEGWTNNFCNLMDAHPIYIDKNDAFAGRWMYFMSKMRPNKWNPKYGFDHLIENQEKYNIIHGIGDDAHFAPDFKLGLQLGWDGLLYKMEVSKALNPEAEKIAFYTAHEQAIKSIQGWINRHIIELNIKIALETDGDLKANLEEMLLVNQAILNGPPKTLRQACQWIIWYHLASRTYNRDGAGGQIDTLLQPYYENDINNGLITKDEAVYYLSCFLINDPIYWQLGGPDGKGGDVSSELSFLILEAADLINTSLNITIRVHENMNEELFKTSLTYLIKNKNAWPRYSGDKALVEGFMRNGYSEELARQRIAVGCNWMSLPGLEYTMNDLVKVNMVKVFEVAFGELIKLQDKSTEALWSLFEKHLKIAVQTAADGILHHLKYQKYNEPELILNLLSYGPMERGLDVSDGGAMYYNLSIDGAGLAVVADSFAAIQQQIELDQKLDWSALEFHLESNFTEVNGERIRQLMQNSPRFGQGETIGDAWAKKISQLFTKEVKAKSNKEKNHCFIPGLFSWANTVGLGKAVGATPNGRKAGTPISHGANPTPGFVVDGGSLALANAIADVQPGFGNTAPMQWELDPSLAKEEHSAIIGAIIKTHFNRGGTLINVNIMDKEEVLAAHKDPHLYPDLVVRITGFTAYFAMLTQEFRQLVVDRILEN